ncbi:hypothetical protein LR48_Vigan02g102700 [Vigna angularis]|uniref:Uncharacterized protein n=1 Tax=Phaseolus angularis TaxID=3914 RepID=A0A0L9TWS5_PHAAN|nr:hypothetical protein LR48_Vigan02g102700 [Vigna angularis]
MDTYDERSTSMMARIWYEPLLKSDLCSLSCSFTKLCATMMDSHSHCSFTNDGSPKSEVMDGELEHEVVLKKSGVVGGSTRKVKLCHKVRFACVVHTTYP